MLEIHWDASQQSNFNHDHCGIPIVLTQIYPPSEPYGTIATMILECSNNLGVERRTIQPNARVREINCTI